MPPSVSIIIPNYNKGPYIAECLQSCIDQGLEYLLEVIFVDDHSTDNSLDVVEAFRHRHPDIVKVFTNPRKGAAAARNVGFEQSTGEYIQYLDSDDVLSGDKIRFQMMALEKAGPDAIANCSWAYFSKIPGDSSLEHQAIDTNYSFPMDWLIDAIMSKGMSAVHGWLTPSSLINQAGPWNEHLSVNDDGEFFARILSKAKEIVYVSDVMAYYRKPLGANHLSKREDYSSAHSLFKSYELMGNHMLSSAKDKEKAKRAYGELLVHFILKYYSKYSDLRLLAFRNLEKLRLNKPDFNFDGRFGTLYRFLGFKNALRARSVFEKLFNLR